MPSTIFSIEIIPRSANSNITVKECWTIGPPLAALVYGPFFSDRVWGAWSVAIDDALIHCFQKGLAIGFGFDCRIPFHEIPFGQISLVVEPKMMYTGFAGDFFLQPFSAIEQSQLVGSA